MTPDPMKKDASMTSSDMSTPENEPERDEKKKFSWLYIVRWCWPLLSLLLPACLGCFYVAKGRQHGQTLRLSPLRLLFNTLAGARDYFGGVRKGSSDAFWGTLTAGAVVAVLLWLALTVFAVFLLCEHAAKRYAKTPEERARAAFRLALFLPREWLLILFGVLRVMPFLFVWWFARVTTSGLGAGTDAFYLSFDPCPAAAAIMGLLEIGLDVAERKTR